MKKYLCCPSFEDGAEYWKCRDNSAVYIVNNGKFIQADHPRARIERFEASWWFSETDEEYKQITKLEAYLRCAK